MQHEPCILHNKVHKKSLKLLFNTNECKADEPRLYIYKHIAYYFYSLYRHLNQDSITSCSRYQLIHFSPHKCIFGRTGFKPLNVLNTNK